MQYNQRLQHVTVLGAAGKMGSGILLLTAMEMANQSLKPENKNNSYVLNAMDVSEEGLTGLMEYLKVQVQKVAEKKIDALKTIYSEKNQLTEDADFVNQYVTDVLAIVKPSTSLKPAYQSTLIFEVIKEDPSLKVKIFKQIDENNPNKPWFFTNTSSIPINKLNEEANLGGRILGVHFYNPPAVQKLVEVIRSKETPQEMIEFCSTYIKNLKKIAVPSNDFAGFIGNGHFMRDAIYGIEEAMRLAEQMPQTHAIYTINKVTQDFLIRPMGIFQLIDYVGIDVCSYILSVMQPYFPNEQLHSDYLNNLLAQGIRGGQHSTGAQKDGIFKYEKGKILAIYDTTTQSYVEIEKLQAECDQWLEGLLKEHQPWKVVNFSPDKESLLTTYFTELKTMNTQGAQLAKAYLKRCVEIGQQLVNDGVANNEQDVNTVMLTGFYHAYGPINNYL
jgi:3-hydroxyacyl-CoA dehydrogenase